MVDLAVAVYEEVLVVPILAVAVVVAVFLMTLAVSLVLELF
jgi:hypothetical protein